MRDASMVLMSLMHDITLYFPEEVTVLAVWVESEQSICVVYTRTIEPFVRLGRRLGFPPHARENDPASTGQAFAELLREPAPLTPVADNDSQHVHWIGMRDVPRFPY
jgi:hypothetical protein